MVEAETQQPPDTDAAPDSSSDTQTSVSGWTTGASALASGYDFPASSSEFFTPDSTTPSLGGSPSVTETAAPAAALPGADVAVPAPAAAAPPTVRVDGSAAGDASAAVPATVSLAEPAAGGSPAASFALPGGQPISVAIDPATLRGPQETLPAGARMEVAFSASPATENAVQNGSLGGGVVTPASAPISIRVRLVDGAGNDLQPSRAEAGDLGAATVTIVLPVLSQPAEADAVFAWLQAIYEDGQFLGYVRPVAVFDAGTGTVRLAVSADAVDRPDGTLFLPVVLRPAYVQNFDPQARIYSGPDAEATDFGVAGPPFTTFVVVAPQVGQRLFVYNPTTENYGWIDVAGVGPAGPPQP